METWKPISASELKELLRRQLGECSPEQVATFETVRVEPYQVPIVRNGSVEQVFVVARKGPQVMYYEDVEEGFNISKLTSDGAIAEPGFEQDELKWALQKWK
jgi:hypothetical protein